LTYEGIIQKSKLLIWIKTKNEIGVKELEIKIYNISKIDLKENHLRKYKETKYDHYEKLETKNLWTKSKLEYFFENLGSKEPTKKYKL